MQTSTSNGRSRREESTVPPQGADVAARCPVRSQCDLLRPTDPLGPDHAARDRLDRRRTFQAAVVAQLGKLHDDAVVIEPVGSDNSTPGAGFVGDRRSCDDPTERTVAAMRSGVPVVIGGRLPVDRRGGRIGAPDLLIADGHGGYHPALIAHRRTRSTRSTLPDRLRSLAAPAFREPPAEWPEGDGGTYRHEKDLLRLAHHRRLLDACGFASPDNVGAVIGKELVVVWFDLDAPIWRTRSTTQGDSPRTTMQTYDFEFAFRLDIISAAQQHVVDPSVGLRVSPVRNSQCASCPWWDHCRSQMERVDDVSLLPYSGLTSWKAHRRSGVRTCASLATLDHRSAVLVDAGIDLNALLEAADSSTPETPLGDLGVELSASQSATAVAIGVRRVADIAALDRRVAGYVGSGLTMLAESIDLARARSHPSPAMIRRGHDAVRVRRGDIEVDLDLENSTTGVYLWGALVTDRVGADLVQPGYHSFVSWDRDPSLTEADTCVALMRWLSAVRSSAHQAGLTCTVYCYNEGVEAGALRRLAAEEGVDPRWRCFVEDLVSSDDWVDLLAVARDCLITGQSMGLKHLAPIAGFGWDDEDPGGIQSMQWHDIAVTSDDPAERSVQRERILTYNRNDVEATRALREWFDGAASELPRLADQDAEHGWA